MKKLFVFFIVCLAACRHKPVSRNFEENLRYGAGHSKSDEAKLTYLARLSEYYMEIDRERSDSIMDAAYSFAEESKDKNVLILAYLLDAQRRFSAEEFQKEAIAVGYLGKQASDLASSTDNNDYMAYGYLYMAHSKRLLGKMNEAAGILDNAHNLFDNSKSDSLKIEFHYLRSQVYQDKRELTNALDDALEVQKIAEQSQNNRLRQMAYRRLGNMYEDLDSIKAEENYLLSAEFAKKTHNDEQLVYANLALSRLYSRPDVSRRRGLKYLEEAMNVAEDIDHRNLIMLTHLSFIRYYLKMGQPDSTIQYINKNFPKLNSYYLKNGLAGRFYYNYGYYNYLLARYYYNRNENRNADYSFRQALAYFYKSDSAYSSGVVTVALANSGFYKAACNYYLYFLNKSSVGNYGYYYMSYEDSLKRKRVSDYYNDALYYFDSTKNLAGEMNDPEFMRNIYDWMEDLYIDSAAYYRRAENTASYASYSVHPDFYRAAYNSRRISDSCNKVFQQFTNQKQSLRIERLHQVQMQEIKEAREKESENIKTIGITVVLALFFIMLVLAGFLRVSESMIKALGVFSFLFLFEFLLLIIDKYIQALTDGEVISLLAIKIAIAAILLPLHHFLEQRVIHSLTKRKLLQSEVKI